MSEGGVLVYITRPLETARSEPSEGVLVTPIVLLPAGREIYVADPPPSRQRIYVQPASSISSRDSA